MAGNFDWGNDLWGGAQGGGGSDYGDIDYTGGGSWPMYALSDEEIDTLADRELAAGNYRPILTVNGRVLDLATEQRVQQAMTAKSPALQEWYSRWGAEGVLTGRAGSNREKREQELEDLTEMRDSFTSPGDWVTRWLLENTMARLKRWGGNEGKAGMAGLLDAEAAREQGLADEMTKAQGGYDWGGGGWKDYRDKVSGADKLRSEAERLRHESESLDQGMGPLNMPTELTIPDWMQPYLATSIQPEQFDIPSRWDKQSKTSGLSLGSKGAYGLAPMGAQAELTPTQKEMLQGYMGWTMAGAPLEFGRAGRTGDYKEGTDYLKRLEQLPSWWEDYVARSKKLAPKAYTHTPARWSHA